MHVQALSKGYTVLHELPVSSGRVDLLCISHGTKLPHSLIEVKTVSSAKHALGQLLAYKKDLAPKYPKLQLVALLFNKQSKKFNSHVTPPTTIKDAFNTAHIKLVYAHDLWTYTQLQSIESYLKHKTVTPCLNPLIPQIANLY